MTFIGSIFGYVLWFAYLLVRNYGLAIILFTIFAKLILFPTSIKQQKTMAGNARMQARQAELKEKYGNNREKLNEETQKLYQKEGVSPYSGCLSTIIPMFIMIGIFYAVAYPLTNTLHIDQSQVDAAKVVLARIPGLNLAASAQYGGQIDILMHFNSFPSVAACFTDAGMAASIANFSSAFSFCGLDLLQSPSGQSSFFSVYLIIPVLCFLTAVLSQFFVQKLNGMASQQKGCMQVMLFALPLFSAYIAYSVPAAVGFYWICSTVLGFGQSLLLHKFFGPAMTVARGEAARVALLEQQEAIR